MGADECARRGQSFRCAQGRASPFGPATLEQRDGVILYVETGCGFHEDVSELPVLGREDDRAVHAVAIEEPSRQHQCGALVSFCEPLGPRYTAGEDGCRFDGILDRGDGDEGAPDALQVVRFVEPLVGRSDRPVERDRQLERGTPQWSWR